ncbi:MAG: hypothetical protein ABI867_15585 [Kofleriaceae bacterium]
MRGIASRILDGTWLGGHPDEGVRSDDPNDRIAHELRRDLRGQYAMFAWLDHVDVKEHNTLDMWVTDPADPGRHYVKHYAIDFGKALGVMASDKLDPRQGHTFYLDYGDMLASLASAGLRERSWEGRSAPELRGVGLYEALRFQSGGWRANTQVNVAFATADRFDGFWAAKILIRFTGEQLRAIVETGRLTDPRSSRYLVDTLVARQRATARYWFQQVAPLDGFAIHTRALCFDDLAIRHRFASATETSYVVTAYDSAGRPLGKPGTPLADVCTPSTGRGYQMTRIRVVRAGVTRSAIVHLAPDPATVTQRVIGLWRE